MMMPNNAQLGLRRAWRPFLSRFGRPTQIQIQAVPSILAGANVVIASATASGKTEAVVAPVAELCVAEQWPALSTLYIVPTRALANDTLVRIEGPLEDMGLSTGVKHGDRSALPVQLPDWLITTPESLDSLICRRSEILRQVRTVIVDEIHLLDNSYRGDQLRILLWRLDRLCESSPVRRHLLSATLARPEEVAARYAPGADIIRAPGQREIEHYIVTSHQEVLDLVRQHNWKKVLYFCNMRESVEAVGHLLGPLWKPYPVVVHHGSLGTSIRREAETVLKESPVAVCVATSTLEVGIDVGDIDLVVLADVPWSLSALLQRIGRANRRDNRTRVATWVQSTEERRVANQMIEMARTGAVPVESYAPELSVVVQQMFSRLFQSSTAGVSEEELVTTGEVLAEAHYVLAILQHLSDKGWVTLRHKRWFPTAKLMDIGWKLHSNIPDSQSFRVIDIDSGREIGTIAGVFDGVFVLAHRVWRVVAVQPRIIRAQQIRGSAPSAAFQRHHNRGAFSHLLPPHLQQFDS